MATAQANLAVAQADLAAAQADLVAANIQVITSIDFGGFWMQRFYWIAHLYHI